MLTTEFLTKDPVQTFAPIRRAASPQHHELRQAFDAINAGLRPVASPGASAGGYGQRRPAEELQPGSGVSCLALRLVDGKLTIQTAGELTGRNR
jgi:hypothetical protein